MGGPLGAESKMPRMRGLYEPKSRLLKGGYMGDYIGEYYRGY